MPLTGTGQMRSLLPYNALITAALPWIIRWHTCLSALLIE